MDEADVLDARSRSTTVAEPLRAPIRDRPLGSVVIAAYDEEAVVGRCLRDLLGGLDEGALEVLVVANGCTDATADVARTFPVRVLELSVASKARALRAADGEAEHFPRIYLDADVVMTGESALRVLEHLARPGMLAARPPLHYDTRRSAGLVRRYYRVRQELPSLTSHLWGAGVYALSGDGRSRFGAFPEVVGDDLYVDQLFDPHEVAILDCPAVQVMTPRTSGELLKVLRRQNKGKRALAHVGNPQRTGRVVTDLVRLLRRSPAAVVDVAVFVGFAVLSRSRPLGPAMRWERDQSSREA